jgi:hypothetical protein
LAVEKLVNGENPYSRQRATIADVVEVIEIQFGRKAAKRVRITVH